MSVSLLDLCFFLKTFCSPLHFFGCQVDESRAPAYIVYYHYYYYHSIRRIPRVSVWLLENRFESPFHYTLEMNIWRTEKNSSNKIFDCPKTLSSIDYFFADSSIADFRHTLKMNFSYYQNRRKLRKFQNLL